MLAQRCDVHPNTRGLAVPGGRSENVYSRAIVGWAMSHTLGGQLATDALAMAISQRGVPELVHSDRGSTYATSIYLDLIRKHGIRQSMSRKGNCWDNAPMESFFHSLKTELVMHCDYKSRDRSTRQPVRLHGNLLQPSAPPLHHQLRGSAGFRGINQRLIGLSILRGQRQGCGPSATVESDHRRIRSRRRFKAATAYARSVSR